MSHTNTRIRRINILLEKVRDAERSGRALPVGFLMNEACMDWGVTRRTVLEYVEILVGAKKIKNINGFVTVGENGWDEK